MKKVTMQAIADRANMTVSGVSKALRRGDSKILSIAKEVGYKTKADYAQEKQASLAAEYEKLLAMAEKRKGGIVNAQMIADDLGYCYHTVVAALNGSKCGRTTRAATMRRIQTYAAMVGYVKMCGFITKQKRFLAEIGNFKSAEELHAHMQMLRDRGYTNIEIAKKCGISYPTVLSYIGTQPAAYTAESLKIAGAYQRAKNAAKGRRVDAAKAAKREKLVQEQAQAEAAHILFLKQADDAKKRSAEIQREIEELGVAK